MKIDPMFPTPRRLGTAIRFLPTDFERYVIGHDIEVAK